jgi:amidase
MEPFASALEQGAAIRDRQVSSVELVRVYLDRIERLNPELNHFWTVTAEGALEQAAAADARAGRGESRGPLDGVAVSIKDLNSVAGVRTTMGSRAFENLVLDWDDEPVRLLREAGACFLGKTTVPEFGSRPHTEHGLHGAAHNPWNREHTTGGSSGGAAGALAAGLCALSHGSDGGGSIRIPAACCGVAGLKPTRGLISPGPVFGESWAGLSTQGPIGRTVADLAAGLDVMAGHLLGDPYWADREASYTAHAHPARGPLRIGFTSASGSIAVDPETAEAVRKTAATLASAGHHVEEAAPDTSGLRLPFGVIPAVGVASLPISDPSLLEIANQTLWEVGEATPGPVYQRAINDIRMVSRGVVAFWDTHDILLTPTLTHPAPRLNTMGTDPATAADEYLDWLTFTYPYNCTGQPAISLPLAMHSSGLPIGIQLVGAPRAEGVLLEVATQLEEAMPWRDRRPAGVD